MRCVWLLALAVALVQKGAPALPEDTVPGGAAFFEGNGGPKDAAEKEAQEAKVIHGMCYVARCIKGHWDVRWKSGCRTSLIHSHRRHPPKGACNQPGS